MKQVTILALSSWCGILKGLTPHPLVTAYVLIQQPHGIPTKDAGRKIIQDLGHAERHMVFHNFLWNSSWAHQRYKWTINKRESYVYLIIETFLKKEGLGIHRKDTTSQLSATNEIENQLTCSPLQYIISVHFQRLSSKWRQKRWIFGHQCPTQSSRYKSLTGTIMSVMIKSATQLASRALTAFCQFHISQINVTWIMKSLKNYTRHSNFILYLQRYPEFELLS